MAATERRRSADIDLAVIQNDIAYIKRQIDHIDMQVSSNYVTKVEFTSELEPLKKFMYALVLGVIGAFVTAIVK